jgi:hypothetical protein
VFHSTLARCAIGFALASCCALGCGSAPVEREADPTALNFKRISQAYREATNDLERPPQNLDELLPFLKKVNPGEPSEILRSPNDGLDYTILWGIDFHTAQAKEKKFLVLVYEKHGKDGRRWVGGFRERARLTDEEFRQANFPPGHRPPA